MSKTITLADLQSWLAEQKTEWKPEHYDSIITYAEHPLYKRALETAYLLDRMHVTTVPQASAIFFVLGIPQEEQPEDLRKFIDNLFTLNKLSSFSTLQERSKSQETLRKMLLALADDVRAIVVMIAYQVILMRNARDFDPETQRLIAKNTAAIFAPLANRLGLARLKWELEDFSLRFLEPDTYKQLASKLDGKRKDREAYIEKIIERLKSLLGENGIEGSVSGRVKHIYSIWKKMTKKNIDFDELFDVRAVRIMVDDVATCYAVLGLVHELWTPIPKEFDDYIANPKPNGYQSLHTAVLGPENKTLEIQIRTYQMHENAELGVAAHWRYKEGSGASIDQKHLNWFRDFLHKELEEHEEINEDELEEGVFDDYVYVMTPAGEPIELMRGSTPLDFAYKIHTDLGHRCRGAKVNGKIVPLTYVLNNQDKVEILAGKQLQPSRDWMSPYLGYTFSNRTRAKVRAWFKAQHQENNLQAGKQMLEKELTKLNIHLAPEELQRLASRLHFGGVNELYSNIGSGDVTLNQVLTRLPSFDKQKKEEVTPDSIVRPKSKDMDTQKGVQVRGVGSLLINMATCCRPAPPDLIGGYITLNRGVSIHRINCSNYQNMLEQNPERRIDVDWGLESEQTVLANLHVTAAPSSDVLKEVSVLASNEGLKITGMTMKSDQNDSLLLDFTLEISHLDQLSRLLERLMQIPDIIEAYRT
ncbi:bifunctional (p)ppGpp synthetase/guanosine-3',5'-bis(diphosphate) 3'-pyrophosphohydrolase [Ignatzschineria sp. RMDPL8A]|uniref:RelA/SpoT family protein n=1 Tax=Ignatzschineria sp. RMDPL8A TaxID=2999236 RepID=UPI00244665CB|nr:bifunctional (p)ppGpp synthetase/guanosine-3',5'-bis(diphosphate) 3'-pyrophosphohydrolase [Ignatzschineria sp. RMDPL8A]MDG9729676.1 bifunctional (p)ppGpp synthetase/guanosine-3',5'-bis(diphosphate) 3'-pyrophosphohydrolase [Ignatzschineria sp. RMDPL8A]